MAKKFSQGYCRFEKSFYICNPKRKQRRIDEVARLRGEDGSRSFNVL